MKKLFVKLDVCLSASGLQSERAGGEPTAVGLKQTTEQVVGGLTRYYYVSPPPWRILWVSQVGELTNISGSSIWLEMLVGWDAGTSGFVLASEEGMQHSKFSVLDIHHLSDERVAEMNDVQYTTLSALIARAPRSDKHGGDRPGARRPRIGSGAVPRTVTLTPEQWQKAELLGGGNASAGLRKAIDKV